MSVLVDMRVHFQRLQDINADKIIRIVTTRKHKLFRWIDVTYVVEMKTSELEEKVNKEGASWWHDM